MEIEIIYIILGIVFILCIVSGIVSFFSKSEKGFQYTFTSFMIGFLLPSIYVIFTPINFIRSFKK